MMDQKNERTAKDLYRYYTKLMIQNIDNDVFEKIMSQKRGLRWIYGNAARLRACSEFHKIRSLGKNLLIEVRKQQIDNQVL